MCGWEVGRCWWRPSSAPAGWSCSASGSSTGGRASRIVFFFSSRRRHTRSLRDWSSDVCSSDLMVDEGLQGVEFISVNTDAQALLNNKADVKVQIGKKLTRGLGAGARPEIGRQAIEENRDEVLHALQGADLVFVTCGMGGGTGTGAAPIISQVARDLGALTIGICTKPFLFEGRKRMRQAEMGIAEMRKHVDTMIVVPNERLLAVVGKGIPFQDALKKADEVLLHATQGISALIGATGLVN